MGNYAGNYTFSPDGFMRLQKDMNFIMNNIDSDNVTRLNTNRTIIKSDDGKTVIDGSVIDFYGSSTSSTSVRMNVGYSTVTGDFGFNVYDKSGNVTASLDSSGKLNISGSLLVGSSNKVKISEINAAGVIEILSTDSTRMASIECSTLSGGKLSDFNVIESGSISIVGNSGIGLSAPFGSINLYAPTSENQISMEAPHIIMEGGTLLTEIDGSISLNAYKMSGDYTRRINLTSAGIDLYSDNGVYTLNGKQIATETTTLKSTDAVAVGFGGSKTISYIDAWADGITVHFVEGGFGHILYDTVST